MIFRTIFLTKQILTREIGGGGQRKHENGVRWEGGVSTKAQKKHELIFVQPPRMRVFFMQPDFKGILL